MEAKAMAKVAETAKEAVPRTRKPKSNEEREPRPKLRLKRKLKPKARLRTARQGAHRLLPCSDLNCPREKLAEPRITGQETKMGWPSAGIGLRIEAAPVLAP